MKAKARLIKVVVTLGMLWATASATWPLEQIPGWPHG
jgi:hypothetical protein